MTLFFESGWAPHTPQLRGGILADLTEPISELQDILYFFALSAFSV
jgi:hypothetical protein